MRVDLEGNPVKGGSVVEVEVDSTLSLEVSDQMLHLLDEEEGQFSTSIYKLDNLIKGLQLARKLHLEIGGE